MALTAENIKELNNMNVAAQRSQLGTVLDSAAGGSFTPAANQANSTATDVTGIVGDFNALLAKLKAAGIMASK